MIHRSRGGDLGQYLASLERLLDLDAAALLPAHGPAIEDPRTLLTGYLDHRRQREQQVIDALRRATPPCRRSPNPSMMVSIRR